MGFRGGNAFGGRIVLLTRAFWMHSAFKMATFRAWFCQACVARSVLLPGALFRAGAFALPLCAPKSHMPPLPHAGVSDNIVPAALTQRIGLCSSGLLRASDITKIL